MKHNYAIKHTKKAKGTKGVLMTSLDGELIFRVYKKNHEFTDYKLKHNDLSVIIDDEDACFYKNHENAEEGILDHSPETLGITLKNKKNTP